MGDLWFVGFVVVLAAQRYADHRQTAAIRDGDDDAARTLGRLASGATVVLLGIATAAALFAL